LRRTFNGLSLACFDGSPTCGAGVGVDVGAGEGVVLLVDCPHEVAATRTTNKKASLQFPIRVNSFSRLESPDYAHSHCGAGKQ